MSTAPDSQPSAEDFYDDSPADETHADARAGQNGNGSDGLTGLVGHNGVSMLRALVSPGIRRRNIPDLNQVAEDLRHLNLDGVSVDQIAAACAEYLKQRETVHREGFKANANAPQTHGIPATVSFGLYLILLGTLALRDPEWRMAMQVNAQYHIDEDGLDDDHADEPDFTDEEDAVFSEG